MEYLKSFIPLLAFIIGFIFKMLLDFNLALWIVKYLYWIPVRSVFRMKYHDISGDWNQLWDHDSSSNYKEDIQRHSTTQIKQLGKYCYSEFYSGDEKYYMFGEMIDNYIIGKWATCNDLLGYFGTFELRIVDKKNLSGEWVGHSKKTQNIYTNKWNWKRKN